MVRIHPLAPTFIKDYLVMEKLTACKNCKHLIVRGNPSLWYNLFCGARTTMGTDFDPYHGDYYESDEKHIREVNKGNCPHYKKRESIFWRRKED